jgi:hypothetical protein
MECGDGLFELGIILVALAMLFYKIFTLNVPKAVK